MGNDAGLEGNARVEAWFEDSERPYGIVHHAGVRDHELFGHRYEAARGAHEVVCVQTPAAIGALEMMVLPVVRTTDISIFPL